MNVRSALLLGQARGAVLLTLASAGLTVSQYSATALKQAVTNYGRASKAQVQRSVQMLLGLDHLPIRRTRRTPSRSRYVTSTRPSAGSNRWPEMRKATGP